MSIFSKLLSGLLAFSIVASSTAASAISLDDGRYYFRYKAGADGPSVENPDDDGTVSKDITAFYVGGVALPFSEELPMKPQWQNDNWIVESPLPQGIVFDPQTRTFSGTPTKLGMSKVSLKGYDKNGNRVASASATFTIVNLPNSRQTVELYAHTGKFFNKALDLPQGVVVQEWKELASPPPGVTYNGRYVDGTPTKDGFYSILNMGYDYNGDVVYAYIGKMLVEDGPTFPSIEDDLRNVVRNPQAGCEYGSECAYWLQNPLPTVKNPISDPVKVDYSFELDSGDGIPAGLTFTRQFPPSTAYFVNGAVFDFYDQVKMRMKAVDVDGTTGYSNWFKLGSAGPKEICKPPVGQSEIALPGIAGRDFLSGGYRVSAGINLSGGIFTLKQGELPRGLSLNETTGVIGGTPQAEEIRSGVYIEAAYPNNPQVEPFECGPYKFDIAADVFAIHRVSPLLVGYHTGSQIDLKFEASGALLDGYDMEIVGSMSNLPPELRLTKTGEKEWSLSGTLQTAGDFNALLRLTNGDGRSRDVSLPLLVRDTLGIGNVANNLLDLHQFALFGVDKPLHDFAVDNAVGRVTVKLDSGLAGLRIDYKSLLGGTTVSPGQYGPFVATVEDEVGATASTAPFYLNVLPRRGLTGETVDPVKLVVNEGSPILPFNVTSEPLAASVYSLTYKITPSTLPEGLSLDPATGNIQGRAKAVEIYPGFTVTAQEVGAVGGTTITSEPFTIEVEEPSPIGTLHLPRLEGNKNGVFIASADPRGALAAVKRSIVGELEAVKFLSAAPLVPGLSLNTATGVLEGIPESEFDGDVIIAIEDSAGRPGELKVTVKIYPYPELSAPTEIEIPRLSKAQDYDVKIMPNAGFYAGQLFNLAPSSQVLPLGLTLDASTGVVRGQSSLSVGTVRNVIVRATSNANGITVDQPVAFKIGQQLPMKLDIPADTVGLFKVNEVSRDVVAAPSITLPTYLTGSYAAPVSWSLSTAPSWLEINPSTGLLAAKSPPPSLGEWTVTVRAVDAEGTVITSPLKVKVTFEGFVNSVTGGEEVVLRQDETFRLKNQVLRNAVPSYSFSSSLPQSESITFNSLTGVTEGFFPSAGSIHWGVQVSDHDGRTFASPLPFSANVLGPLQFIASPVSTIAAVQYDPARLVGLGFPGVVRNIGTVSFGLDGNLPGTLYYKSINSAGRAVYQHFPATGGVETVVQGASETVQSVEGRLSNDHLIFDTNALTLRGIPSQVGQFEVYVVAHDDHQENGYKVNPSDPTRLAYNNALRGPYVLTVAPKPQMQLTASTGLPRYVVVNNQDANMKVSATNVGYGIAGWNVVGGANLPPGVTYQVVADGVQFSGKPTQLGDFSGLTVSATDKIGQTASLNVSFKVIASPDAIGLNVFEIKSKVGLPVRMEPPFSSEVLSTENTYGKLYFATQNGEINGVTIDPITGALTHTASKVGDYVFNLSVTDDTDRITSKPVTVKVMPPLRLVVPTVISVEQGVDTPKAISTDFAIGTVSYEKGDGTWPAGLGVNPVNGTISGRATAAVGDYPGLTVVGRDAAGDLQSSNGFTITVEPIRAKPVIANIPGNKVLVGKVGVAITPFKPTVTDSIFGAAWNFDGTVYSTNHDLSQSGLTFNAATGQLTGTPTNAAFFSDLVITVTSARGDQASTSPFMFGVAPSGDIAAASDLRPETVIKVPNGFASVEMRVVNALGAVTYSPLYYMGTHTFNPATGVVTDTKTSSGDVGAWPAPVRATDAFGRWVDIPHTLRVIP
jgi:hypothetical protein